MKLAIEVSQQELFNIYNRINKLYKNTTNRKGGSENKTERATDNILINGNKNIYK